MACNYNIKVVEGNTFALVLPLKKRTYVSSAPIDEDIVYADLQECVVKIGGVEYAHTIEEYGVQVVVPATLAKGTYDIMLTATYHGSEIRAAYYDGLTIVAYNQQSDAQQYLPGSPIVLDAAYIIGGTLTDAELEALKEEYREKNVQLAQAIEDAEAAKAEWEQKAAELDDMAKESTSQQILQEVENIDIDTSDLAKQGTNPNATLTATQTAATNAYASAEAAKTAAQDAKTAAEAAAQQSTTISSQQATIASQSQRILAFDGEVRDTYDYLESKGAIMPEDKTIENIPATVAQIVDAHTGIKLSGMTIENSQSYTNVDLSNIYFLGTGSFGISGFSYVRSFKAPSGTPYISNMTNMFRGCTSMVVCNLTGLDMDNVTSMIYTFDACSSLLSLDFSGKNMSSVTSMNNTFANCISLKSLNLTNINLSSVTTMGNTFLNCGALETLVGGKAYDEVIANNITAMGGINCAFSLSATILDRASLRAVINGLSDRTGQSSLTLTIGATLLAKLSADDIAVATNKNWTLA